MIALVDSGSGNLRSVGKALERVGAGEVRLASEPGPLRDAAAVVLPGVGAFGDAVRGLRERGLWEPLGEWLDSGKPLLGICVGYQLLFDGSDESPGVAGFGHFRGRVVRFRGGSGLKVPHMGWNRLETLAHPIWEGLEARPHVFFVHSYFPRPDDPGRLVIARAEHGESFAAAIAGENVVATQFHPEKSQGVGLRILENWLVFAGVRAAAGAGVDRAGEAGTC